MLRTLFLGVLTIASGSSPTLGTDGALHTVFNNSLYAVRGDDGSTKWILKGNSSSAFDSHAECGDMVIATLKGGSRTEPDALLALNGSDGSIKWKRQMDQDRNINGHPFVQNWPHDPTIYLTSGLAHCINGTTIDAIDSAGEVQWTYTTAGCGSLLYADSDASDEDAGILFVKNEASLDALRGDTGTVIWSVELGDRAGDRFDVFTSHRTTAFVTSRNHTHSSLWKVSFEFGSIEWQHHFPLWKGDARTNFWAVLGKHEEVYVNGYNLTDGTCGLGVFDFDGNFRRKLPCLPDSPFYSYDEDLFVTIPESRTVVARNGTDGHVFWNVSIPEPLSRGVHFGQDGTVFVWSAGAHANASTYVIQNGNLAWSVQTGGAMDQIMSDDGTMYVQGFRQEMSSPPSEPKLEIVAVEADGVEMWRYVPSTSPSPSSSSTPAPSSNSTTTAAPAPSSNSTTSAAPAPSSNSTTSAAPTSPGVEPPPGNLDDVVVYVYNHQGLWFSLFTSAPTVGTWCERGSLLPPSSPPDWYINQTVAFKMQDVANGCLKLGEATGEMTLTFDGGVQCKLRYQHNATTGANANSDCDSNVVRAFADDTTGKSIIFEVNDLPSFDLVV